MRAPCTAISTWIPAAGCCVSATTTARWASRGVSTPTVAICGILIATRFAHWTWIGDDFGVQGTLVPPGNAVVTRHGLDEDPVPLTTGRYYWHSGPSLDGEWIISDTNWPQEGLYLIHVPTGSANYVCDTRSIGSHPQWTHPHPSLSPGMRYAQYNSDMTGIGQVYLAELTEDFLQQASKGYIIRTDLL